MGNVQVKPAAGRTRTRGDQRAARADATRQAPSSSRRVAPPARAAEESPPVVTLFRAPDGGFFHARCRQPLEYQGRRAQLELDFYCLRCVEHVSIPESVVPRIPLKRSLGEA